MNSFRLRRNEICYCGSGKKFKKCHLRYINKNIDPFDSAKLIMALPDCNHPRAIEIAATLNEKKSNGKQLSIKFKSLSSYLQLGYLSQNSSLINLEAILINPKRTHFLDPEKNIYLALSPNASDSTIIHQFAHILDLIFGSGLEPDIISEIAKKNGISYDMIEHPKEFGDILLELLEKFNIELDAEDEIIAILARHQLLFPSSLIRRAQLKELLAASEKILFYLRKNREEINTIIKNRRGYIKNLIDY